MGRIPELPRIDIEGEHCIELRRSQPLRRLEVDDVQTRDILSAVVSRFENNMRIAREFFEFWTDHTLYVTEEGDDFVWSTPESRYSSAQNKGLSAKVKKYEDMIVKRTNEYCNMLKEAYDATTKDRPISASGQQDSD